MYVMEKLNFLCGNDNLTEELLNFSIDSNNQPCNEKYCVGGIFCWRSGLCSGECAAINF